jgi:hypothetical protein
MRRCGEVEPRVPRVERSHVEGRARVLDEVLVVADRRLCCERDPDLGPFRFVGMPHPAGGHLRRRVERLVKARARDLLRGPVQVQRAAREDARSRSRRTRPGGGASRPGTGPTERPGSGDREATAIDS